MKTVVEIGWTGLKNGELLASAARDFDVLLTVDKNLRYQQNMSTLPLAVVVLIAPTNKLSALLPLVPLVEKALATLQPRSLIEIGP